MEQILPRDDAAYFVVLVHDGQGPQPQAPEEPVRPSQRRLGPHVEGLWVAVELKVDEHSAMLGRLVPERDRLVDGREGGEEPESSSRESSQWERQSTAACASSVWMAVIPREA